MSRIVHSRSARTQAEPEHIPRLPTIREAFRPAVMKAIRCTLRPAAQKQMRRAILASRRHRSKKQTWLRRLFNRLRLFG